jgi:hypothetical protein
LGKVEPVHDAESGLNLASVAVQLRESEVRPPSLQMQFNVQNINAQASPKDFQLP